MRWAERGCCIWDWVAAELVAACTEDEVAAMWPFPAPTETDNQDIMNTEDHIETLMELGPDPTYRACITFFEVVGMPAAGFVRKTRLEYGKDLRDLAAFLEKRGILHVDQIRLPQLEIYQAVMRERGYTPSTRQRKVCAIRAHFRFLHEHGVTRHDVARKLIPPRRPAKLPRHLSRAEIAALTSSCEGSVRDYAIVQLLLQTGMALHEVAAASVDDLVGLPDSPTASIDQMGHILVHGRGARERSIPLNSTCATALRAYLDVRPADGPTALFLSRTREPMSVSAVSHVVDKYLGRAGIQGATPRVLRHTHAVHHALRGTSRDIVQENLGLAREQDLDKYWKLADRDRRKALQEHAL